MGGPEGDPKVRNGYGVDVGVDGWTVVIKVRGEVDISTAPHFLDTILSAAQSQAWRAVVVDFNHLEFIDSSGLRALVVAKQHIDELQVVNPPASALRIMTIAGLHHLVAEQAAPPAAMLD